MIDLDVRVATPQFTLVVRARLGETACVFGPSGAGKTTLLEAVAGLRPAVGRIVVGDDVLLDTARGIDLAPEKRRVGFVPQDGALFPHLDVRRNLGFGRRAGEASWREVVDALELEPLLQRMPRQLSGGEVRRVALARALLAEPRVLLLDEPTAGLDAARARRALARVLEVRRRFRPPLLVVTHREEEALALAEDLVLLEAGRVRASGPARVVLRGAPEGEGTVAENVVHGRVVRHDGTAGATLVGVDGVGELSVPLVPDVEAGAPVVLALDVSDVLVAIEAPRGLSARNVVDGEIEDVVEDAHGVIVHLGGWRARVTHAAARELGLAPGRHAWLVTKTHGWRVVAG